MEWLLMLNLLTTLPEPSPAKLRMPGSLLQTPVTYAQPDSVTDGLIKGALLGVVVAVLMERGLDSDAEFGPTEWGIVVAMYAGAGGVIDALHQSRAPRVRPGWPPPTAPKIRLSLRF
jgi:hypothetical protein